MQVTEGSGKVMVTAVGVESEWGKTMALVAGESHDTPLQESLGVLAAAIGKVGLAVGVLCFVVLMIRSPPPHGQVYPSKCWHAPVGI
jgi:Ca2+-transporting ATPase